MARVFRRPASALARRASSRAAQRAARKHKVVMESVTQEKKKLRSVISFEAKAPPGYTFIPAGNPQLTSACKEICRKDGLNVFAVTTTPHMHTHNLSQHVHRIGYHFPSAVVATVCMDLGLYLTPTGKAMPFRNISYTQNRKRTNSESSQTTINTEARDVLKDLFPNIPDNDLNQIIKTAFQKGQRKVGTAVELPLARRAQLAVVAHIRHVYTDYDRLLKTTSFHEARSIVEEPTLAKLVEWRGDDENGKTVLEDVFREVIVISDDEDSDTEGDIPQAVDRDYSVKIISSHPRAEDLQMKPVNYSNSTHREHHLETSDEEAPPGFHFIRIAPKRPRIDRRGFSRYQAWDRAIHRYRNAANRTDQRKLYVSSPNQGRPIYATQQPWQDNFEVNRDHAPVQGVLHRQISAAPYGNTITGPHILAIDPVAERRPYEVYPISRSPRQREAVLKVVQAPESSGAKHLLHQGDPPNAPVFVSGPKKVLGNNGNQPGSGPIQGRPNVNPQDCVLPSIEPPLSPENNTLDNGLLDHIAGRMSGGCSIRSLTPRRLQYKDIQRPFLEDRTQDQLPKRRRVAYYEPVNVDKGLSHIARTSNPVDAFTGERYMALGYPPGKSPVQGDIHIRKRYLAPFDPIPQSESQLGKVQVSSLSATHHDLKPGTLLQEDYEPAGRQSLPRNQSHETRTQWRSQGQLRPLPEAGMAFPTTHCSDRAVPGRSSNFSEQTNFHQDHYTNESTKPFNVSESYKSTRGHTNDHALMALGNTQWRRHYADDFVRTIDSQAPIPMEYPAQHHFYRDHAREPLTQQAYFQLPHHPSYNTTVPGNVSSKQPSVRDSLHSPAQCYAMMDNSGIRYHDAGLVESAYTERPFQDSHNFPRKICEQQPHTRYTPELDRPTYVRRGDRSQPCHSVPEGRTVVIVD
ncbi:hypothetical protein BDV27DRAFT_124955 [Aspergillus caelatus]|uniref:DUF2293 domain-containing protein n=1 Tax=Aspergillus caelatus TaxID=61420 RepID=A0A5N7AAE2_9EURO|nr:uncharacterized protein BDV27DRAFT_124955 [Aspergillus caelatus]KAE8366675.1 hypothetical protein BDV27DRAFT_124955 [Aspergillus caelatus]